MKKKKEIEKLWSIESGSKNYRKIHKKWENRTVLQIKSEYKSKYKYRYKYENTFFIIQNTVFFF